MALALSSLKPLWSSSSTSASSSTQDSLSSSSSFNYRPVVILPAKLPFLSLLSLPQCDVVEGRRQGLKAEAGGGWWRRTGGEIKSFDLFQGWLASLGIPPQALDLQQKLRNLLGSRLWWAFCSSAFLHWILGLKGPYIVATGLEPTPKGALYFIVFRPSTASYDIGQVYTTWVCGATKMAINKRKILIY
uniref:Uncharacterized protein n=1 Tax=Fagus sylvatica TaxID=28930 RepID=A0A2N9I8Q4_FAGSY